MFVPDDLPKRKQEIMNALFRLLLDLLYRHDSQSRGYKH
jgi:hypothetical protein